MSGLIRPEVCLALWGWGKSCTLRDPREPWPQEPPPAGPPGGLTRGGEDAGSEEQGRGQIPVPGLGAIAQAGDPMGLGYQGGAQQLV